MNPHNIRFDDLAAGARFALARLAHELRSRRDADGHGPLVIKDGSGPDEQLTDLQRADLATVARALHLPRAELRLAPELVEMLAARVPPSPSPVSFDALPEEARDAAKRISRALGAGWGSFSVFPDATGAVHVWRADGLRLTGDCVPESRLSPALRDDLRCLSAAFAAAMGAS